ncbi:Clavaminate synthase-like protein [Corynespora cassiicola Philippines]|uniref:Clavaminate synthase-like protein n=1 Tax=Corynespora cassiicola Philippines TaxID=1448308 RepID=A0A2T2NDC4_CORCC|nr:Clavaminate synthase-like protein [Corynespora cassiicola Philippines]
MALTRLSLTTARHSLRALRTNAPRVGPAAAAVALQYQRTFVNTRSPGSAGAAPAASAQPEHLVHDASNAGQLDGKPAKHVVVSIDGDPRTFDTAFLRDSCACPQCVDPDSHNKMFQTSDIPEDLEASCRTVIDKEKGWMVELVWKNDVKGYGPDHRTRHSINWLRRALNTELELRGGVRHDERVLWDREKITANNKWVDYKEYMAHDEVLFDALSHLNKYGLLFLNNVPESEESVVDIASRIGTLKDTFYGRTWDVRSKPKAENIAYTQHFLGLHMDLLYTSNPPYLQLLHSLRARTPGGESFFSDSFHAAHQLHSQSAFHFRTLCTSPVTYHYHHPTYHYHYTRPTIELHPYPKYSEPTNLAIRRINWSPPFQAPFESRIGMENQNGLRNYISAANAFEKLVSSEENLYEYRLNEGECVIFDNRRVLHARKAFDATKGERWLKGAYVDDDVFFSKLRVLDERFTGKWIADGTIRHAVK